MKWTAKSFSIGLSGFRFRNPNGITPSSPRFARNACLGFTSGNENNLNEIVAVLRG